MFGIYGHDQYIREYELELGMPWGNREPTTASAIRSCTPTASRRRRCSSAAKQDYNVPCIGAQQMYQALRSLDVPTQLVIYPGEYHGLTVPSYLRDRLERDLDWYGRYLKP